MRAYSADSLGDLDDFAFREFPSPEPGRGEILVAVEACALGFVDQLVMRGLYQVKPLLPFVPGGEIVGRVEKLGPEAKGVEIGQRIASWQFGGGLADKVTCDIRHAVAVPDALGPSETAALLLDYLTAYYGLFDRGGLLPGQTLLVTGASGGVGSAAVQLASVSGAQVIALASGEAKQAFAANLGAARVIDYAAPDWRDTLKREYPGGVDRVFDAVGGDVFELCFRSLAKGGRHLVVGFAAGGIPSLPANLPLLKSGELVGVDARYLWEVDPARTREILSIVLSMAAAGKLRAPIARRFDLADATEAIAFVTSEDRLGKTVVLL